MNPVHVVEALLVQEERHYKLTDLSHETGLEPSAFMELIECDILAVVQEGPDQFLVSEHTLLQSRRAARLARDFELSPHGIALAMRLLERIEELEAMLARKPGVMHK